MAKSPHVPFVPADKIIPEITFRAVFLGTVLGVVLAAANTYLGLYAGMTVSASIPAAVLSMGILRGLLKNGTILENNIVQTIAASGESLAAGIIFTVPALLIVGVWKDIHFWPTTLICISGGLLGICFMIPLRKSHIVDDETLIYPEGVACAEVLKAGETSGSGAKYVVASLVLGALFKFFTNGYSFFKGTVEWVFTLGRTPFYFGSDISPALLGVGYILGLNISFLFVVGGFIAWGIFIPVMGLPEGGDLVSAYWTVWSTQVRYLGVGGMIVGGVWSIFNIRGSILKGVSEALLGYRRGSEEETPVRTELNMARKHITLLLLFATATTFCLYYYLIKHFGMTLISTAVMLVMSFFFVAVSSYIVGIIGSSNSPVSGMTICAVLITGGLLFALGLTGERAIIATLGVAGVVCCAVCSAADISQDLKTGYIIGATPRSQQWMEVLGAAIPAFVMAPILIALHHGYGIGTGQAGSLKAPQANLFASLAKGIFGGGHLPWNMVWVGAGIGILFIVIDEMLKVRKSQFRMPVMAVAVGMYLPLTLAAPLLLGGIARKLSKETSDAGSGVLFASGLVAGEAIIGVLLGIVAAWNKQFFPQTLISSDLLSLAALVALAGLVFAVARRKPSGA